MNVPEQTAIILLAAGESSRMGRPKQLLKLNGKSLLCHAVEKAIRADIGPVIVVLGAFLKRMEKELDHFSVEKVVNDNWQQGMGSSIRAGILAVQKHHLACRGTIIMLTDQPYADEHLLKKLIQTHQDSQMPIVASAYKEILGVPAYFHQSYFSRLSQLEGQMGARKFIQQHFSEVASVPFAQGIVDIDTPQDYNKIKKVEDDLS